MTSNAQYPVLYGYGEEKPEKHPTWPRTVPWDFIAEHEAQCRHNHGQTARRLAECGGLALRDIIAVVSDCGYHQTHKMTEDEYADKVNDLVAEWLMRRQRREIAQ